MLIRYVVFASFRFLVCAKLHAGVATPLLSQSAVAEIRTKMSTLIRQLMRWPLPDPLVSGDAFTNARRLEDTSSAPTNFTSLCESPCWAAIGRESRASLHTLATEQCASVTEANTPNASASSSSNNEKVCMFDICIGNIALVCTNLPAYWPQLEPIYPNGTAHCYRAALESTCNSVCHAVCSTSIDERTIFCPLTGETASIAWSSQGFDGGMPSASEYGDIFNFICLYNPVKKFFCYDKIVELAAGGAFQEASSVTAFPDLCKVDCSVPTARAIVEIGCCYGAFLDYQHRVRLTLAEHRSASAAALTCGFSDGDSPLALCSQGLVLPTTIIVIPISLNEQLCAAISQPENATLFTKSLSRDLGVAPSSLDVLTCQDRTQGCDILAKGMELNISVRVSADTNQSLAESVVAIQGRVDTSARFHRRPPGAQIRKRLGNANFAFHSRLNFRIVPGIAALAVAAAVTG